MRAHAGVQRTARQGSTASPSSSPLHARLADGRAIGPAPAAHDLASVSIQPPAGAPIQRESWWKKKAKDAGNYLWGAARDSSGATKAVASSGVGAGLGAVGALAYGGAAALTASTLGTAALVGGAAYGLYRGVDYLMSPSTPPEARHLQLPADGVMERPKKKAKGVKGKDASGASLTAHHKIPFNQIRDTVNDATGNSWSSLIPGRQARARANLAIWGAREGNVDIGPKALTWTPHNLFMGPLSEHRDDDPDEALDTHFTASGSVTPRSELALDVTHQGGLSRFDPKELRKRLTALAAARSQASAYDETEWQGAAGHRTQTAQPPGWENLTTGQKVERVANRRAAKRGKGNKGGKKHK